MKKGFYFLLLLTFFRITTNAQCNPSNVTYTVQQPTTAGGTGNVVFITQQAGYYIMNTRDYSNQYPLFTGATWPGTAGKYTFSNLSIGTYTFVLLRPLTSPSSVPNPNLSDDYYCSQFIIEIKATQPKPFTITTNNSTSCAAANGSITISGLPNINVYGVKFFGQSTFTQTFGANALTSAASYLPGNYVVVVTTDINNASATQYKLPAFINSNTGLCAPSSSAFNAIAANVNDCTSNGTITVSGLPSGNNNFGIKFPTETSFTQTNGATSFTNANWYNLRPGFYTVELLEVFNNPLSRKYLLPVTIKSNTGLCSFPYSSSTTNTTGCSATNGSITISNLPQWQGYGVLFPGQSAYVSTTGPATSVTSTATYAPGTYMIQVRQGNWSQAPCVFTFVTIGSSTGACTAPVFGVTSTNTSDCFSTNGTITVSGFPLNSALYGVKFPGTPNFIQLNAGETSISTPIGASVPAGNYSVIVSENIYNPLSTTHNLPITVGTNTGTCPPPAPVFSALSTNASTCVSTDGRISVLGFIAGQNYGVKFPDQQNYMLVADGQSVVTSPVGLSIPSGNYDVSISSNVYDLFAPITTLQVTVGSNTGVCVPAPSGFNDYPDCNSNEVLVYNENFGATGIANSSYYNGTLPPGYTSDYVTINSSCNEPGDGKLSILNTTDMAGRGCSSNKIFGNIQVTADHTGNLGGAYMFVNGSYNPGKIFEKTITGLCAGSLYTFSTWVKDLAPYVFGNVYNFRPIPPKLSFYLNGSLADNDALPTSTLIEPAGTSWIKVGFQFYADNAGSATLIIRNDAPGGIGNDFAIDDISLAKCEPNIGVTADIFCTGATAILNSTISGGTLANTRYRWYKNNVAITGWTTNSAYATNIFAAGNQFYVEIAEAANTANASCIYKSGTATVATLLPGCYVLPDNNIDANIFTENNNNFIKWTYNKNSLVSYYQIQSSVNGNKFETIKTVKAIGDGKFVYKNQVILNTNFDINYYRIVAVLNNNKQEFSTILSTKNYLKEFFITLNENPAKDKISLIVTSQKRQTLKVSVVNMLGNVIATGDYKIYQGKNNVDIVNTTKLINGTYIVKINADTETYALKTLVQH
jgi:Secretion system C-terminal sorting domain